MSQAAPEPSCHRHSVLGSRPGSTSRSTSGPAAVSEKETSALLLELEQPGSGPCARGGVFGDGERSPIKFCLVLNGIAHEGQPVASGVDRVAEVPGGVPGCRDDGYRTNSVAVTDSLGASRTNQPIHQCRFNIGVGAAGASGPFELITADENPGAPEKTRTRPCGPNDCG